MTPPLPPATLSDVFKVDSMAVAKFNLLIGHGPNGDVIKLIPRVPRDAIISAIGRYLTAPGGQSSLFMPFVNAADLSLCELTKLGFTPSILYEIVLSNTFNGAFKQFVERFGNEGVEHIDPYTHNGLNGAIVTKVRLNWCTKRFRNR
jgi:hypothetical protein